MKNDQNYWTKTELKIYILLLCSRADAVEREEEISLIKSKVDPETFEKIYEEFSKDTEDQSLDKIRDNIGKHHYSHMELYALRREMQEVFLADDNFKLMERNLERILENMLY